MKKTNARKKIEKLENKAYQLYKNRIITYNEFHSILDQLNTIKI